MGEHGGRDKTKELMNVTIDNMYLIFKSFSMFFAFCNFFLFLAWNMIWENASCPNCNFFTSCDVISIWHVPCYQYAGGQQYQTIPFSFCFSFDSWQRHIPFSRTCSVTYCRLYVLFAFSAHFSFIRFIVFSSPSQTISNSTLRSINILSWMKIIQLDYSLTTVILWPFGPWNSPLSQENLTNLTEQDEEPKVPVVIIERLPSSWWFWRCTEHTNPLIWYFQVWFGRWFLCFDGEVRKKVQDFRIGRWNFP